MSDSGLNQRCTVILTAIPAEYRAVHAHLIEIREEMHPLGTVYERGKFSNKGVSWDIGIVEVGAGNADTALAADRAIAHFNPIIVLFVGVAGGLKDVALGDVVAATKVYGYESGKAGIQFETRPEVGNSAFRMEERARHAQKQRLPLSFHGYKEYSRTDTTLHPTSTDETAPEQDAPMQESTKSSKIEQGEDRKQHVQRFYTKLCDVATHELSEILRTYMREKYAKNGSINEVTEETFCLLRTFHELAQQTQQ